MTNLSTIIDAYAALKAQMGRLEAEKKALETALAELPAGAYETDHYRLTISNRLTHGPDVELKAQEKAIAEEAVAAWRETLSRQYLTAHMVEKTVRSHLVGLPTGRNLAA